MRVSTRWLSILMPVIGLGCASDPGEITLAFSWNPAPTPVEHPVFVRVRLLSATGDVIDALGPVLFERAIDIDFSSVANEDELRVDAAVLANRFANARALYRGSSAPFAMTPNVRRVVEVVMRPVTEAPGAGPPSPNTADVHFEVAPRGRDGEETPWQRLVGSAGATLGGARVLVFDGADVTTALEIASSDADADGAFAVDFGAASSTTSIAPPFIAVLDAEGRLSDAQLASPGLTAERVRDVRLILRPGSSDDVTVGSVRRSTRTRTPVVPTGEDGRDSLRARDGVLQRTRTKPVFEMREGTFAPPHRLQALAMASDPTTGDMLVVGGREAFDTYRVKNGAISIVPSPRRLPRREWAGLAYDIAEAAWVVFGGQSPDGLVPLADAWLLGDDDTWRSAPVPDDLAGRFGHAMAYHADLAALVLHSGQTKYATYPDQTWLRRDGRWQLDERAGPGGRFFHAMAYDEVRKQLVMYGGANHPVLQDGLLNDTWIYDGLGWREVPTDATPGARRKHVMVYDRAGQRVLLHGGESTTGRLDDLWSWDGRRWEEVSQDERLVARIDHAAAYDETLEGLVVVGGQIADNSTVTSDAVRVFRDGHWYGAVQTGTPGTRGAPSLAYDRARRRLVMYGNFPQHDGSTWVRDGRRWRLADDRHPGELQTTALVFDPLSESVISRGGQLSAGTSTMTWRFDGARWLPRPVDVARPAGTPIAVFDQRLDRTLLLPGSIDPFAVWTLETDGWQMLSAAGGPPEPLVTTALAHASRLGITVLFSGTTRLRRTPDTYVLDATGWRRVDATGPGGRVSHALSDDPINDRVVLYGGFTDKGSVDDLWSFDGERWSEIDAGEPRPTSHLGHAMAFDPFCSCVVVFGGKNPTFADNEETWELHDGPGSRPSLRVRFDAAAFGLSPADLVGASIDALAGGTGFAEDGTTRLDGMAVEAWNERRATWVALGDNDGTVDGPAMVRANVPPPVQDFSSDDLSLELRLGPLADSGMAPRMAEVVVDYLEVELRFSLEVGETCGDGFVTGDERCDDGNDMAGDGCSADCFVER